MHLADITMFYAPEGGGVSTYLNAKARWLAQRRRVQHTIFSPSVTSCGVAPALIRLPGMNMPGLHGYRLPLSVRSAANSMQAVQPDLVEAGDAAHAAWAALRVSQRLHIPAVAFYHSDLPRLVHARLGRAASAAARRYLRQLYRRFDLVLAPSRRMVEQLAAMGIHGAVHQPLGIDSTIFTPQRRVAALRDHLRLAPETRLLVFAGRFTPEKRLPLLLDVMRRLGPRYHLLLIGSGMALPRATHTTQLPFVRDQVTLAHMLASCDLLVHPGDCETFGLIVLEAMACGLPVVATRSGGVAELVDDSSGILTEPNNVDALCCAIEAIFDDDRASMGEAAAQRVRRLYDWNVIMPQLMQRYAGLLALREGADLDVERICATD